MEAVIAAFIVGIAVGMALHRLIMALVLETWPDNICSYCEWCSRKKSRHLR